MNSSGRYSIRQVAIDHLMASSEHFKTTDISDLILGICLERQILLKCLGQPTQQIPKSTNTPEAETLAEFSGLLND